MRRFQPAAMSWRHWALESAGRGDVRTDLAGLADQGFWPCIDVGDLAVRADGEAQRGLLITCMVEDQPLVIHDLDLGVDLLDLDGNRDRVGCSRQVMVYIDDVFAGDQAPERDDLLADRVAD